MPQRKGRVAEVMRLREWREELVTYHGMVAVVFDDDPVRQFELMGVLEEEMEESEREEREMMEWWSPHIDVSEQTRSLASFSDDELRGCFRFDREDVRTLLRLLEVPAFFWAKGSTRRFGGEEAFLLMLRRLAGREKGAQLAAIFNRSQPAISEMYNVVLDHVYQHAKVAMHLELWEDELPKLARLLEESGCPLTRCCGFVDGTMFDICRPTIAQESMYNGWKRKHKTKYQCVVLPNFLIGDWFGPAPGRANDANIMANSRLVPRLQSLNRRGGSNFRVYGDAAYPMTDVIVRAPKGNNITHAQQEFATEMSKYREAVEWVFGKLGNVWPFVTDVTRKMTGTRATAKEDWVAALLTNYHTCAYGGVANSYFHITPPTMKEYRARYERNLRD